MGISLSGIGTVGKEQLISSCSNGEPNWSYIPTKGKSSKTHAEFVSEIKELARRAATTANKTEYEYISRQVLGLRAEYLSDVAPDRKQIYEQAKNTIKNKLAIRNAKDVENYHYWIFWRRQKEKAVILLKRSLHWREEEH